MTAPRLTCLFHDSATIASFLNTDAGRPFGGDLMVECSREPALSLVLNLETPPTYPGISGLLGGVDIGSLAHPSDHLPAPVILGAGAPVSFSAIRSALALLRKPDERLSAVTLLVRLSDARPLGAALAWAERFAIAWDVGAFPHEELLDFGRWLAAERLLNRANFSGLFPYATVAPEPAQARRLTALLAPYAGRIPQLHAGILASPG